MSFTVPYKGNFAIQGDKPIQFTVPAGTTRYSAGIFKNGNLIRTLVCNKSYSTGETIFWDGLDDIGRLCPFDNYDLIITSNNLSGNWLGVAANTSDSFTGPGVHHGLDPIAGMAYSPDGYVYYITNYEENTGSLYKFHKDSPNTRIRIYPLIDTPAMRFICTDGARLYFGSFQAASGTKWFIHAFTIAGETDYTFPSGTLAYGNQTATTAGYSAIGYGDGEIRGIDVQQSGNYLIAAYPTLGVVKAFNKNTGELVATTTISVPAYPCIDNTDNALWLITYNTPAKYTINADGTLTATGITAASVSQTVGAGMSYNRQTLMICDAGTNQQVKAIDTNGRPLWTLGQQGGYLNNAIAANDKFSLYFQTTDSSPDYYYSYVCGLPDSSFWIGDPGNRRNQHFDASRNFIGTIQYLPRNYDTSIDKNNVVRAFAGMLEFQLDYNNVRNWIFKANWSASLSFSMLGNTLLQVCTLTANNNEQRTFAFIHDTAFSPNRRKLHELKSDGTLRDTGIYFASNTFTQLYPDGSLRRYAGTPKTFYRTDWNGTFDTNGNPVWGAEYGYVTLPDTAIGSLGDSNTAKAGETTSSGKLIVFANDFSTGYHLAGVNISTATYSFLACPSTYKAYTGDFPNDGSYDIGNLVKNTAVAMVTGNYIAWLYYGESWKNQQTNVINLFNDKGQMLLQFGLTAPKVNASTHNPKVIESAEGVAGNATTPFLIQHNNKLYVIHGDESAHSGFHMWQVDGLDTIYQQSLTVALNIRTKGVLSRITNALSFANTSTFVKRVGNFIPASYFPSSALGHALDFYVQPSTTETYTLYLNTGNGVKLYVDGVVKIDQLTNTTQSEFTTTINFTSGKFYTIKIEQLLQGNKKIDLQWSSDSIARQSIPINRTYPPMLVQQDVVSLLEDLPLFQSFGGGYGWTMTPAPYTSSSSSFFKATTNVISVVNTTSGRKYPDISISIAKSSSDNTNLSWSASRDLGNSTTAYWQLNLLFHIAYSQYPFGTGTLSDDGGCYIEVLDRNNLSICRWWYWTDNTNIYVRFNDQMIVQDVNDTVRMVVYTLQNLQITAEAGVLTARYAAYNPVSTSVTPDVGADMTSPKTMRVYGFAKSGRTLSAQTINIYEATFKINK